MGTGTGSGASPTGKGGMSPQMGGPPMWGAPPGLDSSPGGPVMGADLSGLPYNGPGGTMPGGVGFGLDPGAVPGAPTVPGGGPPDGLPYQPTNPGLRPDAPPGGLSPDPMPTGVGSPRLRQRAQSMAGIGDPRMAQLQTQNPDRFQQAQRIQRVAGNRGGVENIPGHALRRIFGR